MNLNGGFGVRLAEYRKEQIYMNAGLGYERLNNDFSIDWSDIFDDGEGDFTDDDDDEISPKK